MKRALDVSGWNGNIDWQAVAAQTALAVDFVWVKAAEGAQTVDKMLAVNVSGLRDTAIRLSAYDFLDAGIDARDQAQHFIDVFGPLRQDNDLPVMLDLERGPNGGCPRARDACTWIEIVEPIFGPPLIYTGPGAAALWKVGATADELVKIASYRLWEAHYTTAVEPLICSPWPQGGWSLWQFEATGRVQGIRGNVDVSRVRDGLFDMAA